MTLQVQPAARIKKEKGTNELKRKCDLNEQVPFLHQVNPDIKFQDFCRHYPGQYFVKQKNISNYEAQRQFFRFAL